MSDYFVVVELENREPLTYIVTGRNPEAAALQALQAILPPVFALAVYHDEETYEHGEKPDLTWLSAKALHQKE